MKHANKWQFCANTDSHKSKLVLPQYNNGPTPNICIYVAPVEQHPEEIQKEGKQMIMMITMEQRKKKMMPKCWCPKETGFKESF